ncbi:MAG: leucyl/phenylalanyl-tRNA--protein transferase [Sphingomonadales bacterium]
MNRITPELLLHAYAQGYFPMAESATAEDLFWVDPEERGLLPLDAFHLPRRLARLVRRERFTVTCDRAFDDVMRHCAMSNRGRESTWINPTILQLYGALHRLGFAHSVECWRDDLLAGGLYGVSLGAGFFGESMFHIERDASKVALVYLVARLRYGDYRLLDTQFVTEHLSQFGAIEIPRAEYRLRLQDALSSDGDFSALPFSTSGERVAHLSTQTS